LSGDCLEILWGFSANVGTALNIRRKKMANTNGKATEVAEAAEKEAAPLRDFDPGWLETPPTPEEVRESLLSGGFSEAQMRLLLQPTPRSEIKERDARGGTFSYVDIKWVTDRLNLIFGARWNFEIKDKWKTDSEREAVVVGRLTVYNGRGEEVVKEQFGGADIKTYSGGTNAGKPLSEADDYKGAASDACKKCAMLLGIGHDLGTEKGPYGQRDGGQRQGQGQRAAARPTPSAPALPSIPPEVAGRKSKLVKRLVDAGAGLSRDQAIEVLREWIPAGKGYQDLTDAERDGLDARVETYINERAAPAL
jgi:hypothetical protein